MLGDPTHAQGEARLRALVWVGLALFVAWLLAFAPPLVEIDHCADLACDFRRHYLPQANASWSEQPRVVQGWYYPPALAAALRPAVGLGVQRATRWWMGIEGACALAMCFATAHHLRHLGARTRWAAAALLVGLSFPVWHNLKWGQVSLPIAAIIAAATGWGERAASCAIGLAAGIKLYPGAAWYAMKSSRKALVLGAGAATALGAAIPLLSFGAEHTAQLFAASSGLSLTSLGELAPQGLVLTVARWLPLPFWGGVAVGLVPALWLGLRTWRALKTAQLPSRVALCLLAVTALLLPTAWHHTYCFLPWVWAILWQQLEGLPRDDSPRRLVAFCLLLSVLLSAVTLVLLSLDLRLFDALSRWGVTTVSALAAWLGLIFATPLDRPKETRPEASKLTPTEHHRLVVVSVASLGGLAALRLWWLCDDAFISFRYAENLVAGKGLVFLEGEYVEGFTNLLWTLWIAVGHAMGVRAELWAPAWGVIAFAGACGLLAHLQLRARAREDTSPWPWAGIALALYPDAAIWATSGLENAPLILAITAAYGCVTLRAAGQEARPALAAVLTVVAAGLRPDGILLAPVLGATLLLEGREMMSPKAWNWRPALRYTWVVSLLWAAMMAARVAYYGDFFPNTYYAKSAYASWWSQGWLYVATFYERAGVYLLAFALVVFETWRSRGRGEGRGVASLWAALGFATLYTLYVARVGGDFMYARLLVPTLPLLLLAFFQALARHPPRWAHGVAALAVLAPLVLPAPVTLNGSKHGIADEHAFYSDPTFEVQWRRRGVMLAEYLNGTDVRLAFLGVDARTVRDADIAFAIETESGLTDATTARQVLTERTRPGHEKRATPGYLLDERKVHLALGEQTFRALKLAGHVPQIEILLPDPSGVLPRGQSMWVLRWSPEIMQTLAARGAVVPDIEALVREAVGASATLPQDACERLHRGLQRLYFDQVPDPEAQAVFERRCPLR